MTPTRDVQVNQAMDSHFPVVLADSAQIKNEDGDSNGNEQSPQIYRGWRFWAIFPALSITALLSAVEATVTSTAMPTIVADLDIGEDYVWIINAFLLTSMAFQPIFGQLADIFGRRWLTISAVALFVLGSGISGGATTGATLIGGRTIQGIGSGGINMLIDVIVCDLVPLRERGKFVGLIMSVFTIGSSMGPFIGGAIVQNSSWRWVFWINLPIGGVSLVLLIAFLHVNYKKAPLKENLRRIDWIGNFIIVGALVALLFALTYAGTKYAWSSWQILVPLIIGFLGIAAFHLYEKSSYCIEPTMPPRLFGNRTSAVAYFLTFIHAILTLWIIYFLPVYFQSVLGSSPTKSGVQLLPTVLALLPFAIGSGVLVSKTGLYRPSHFAGMATITIGFGLFTLLDSQSSTATWICFQIVEAAGAGFLATALLPAVQAGLLESDTASSTATWAYVRSFGAVWGVTIPASIFNNQFDKLLWRISDPGVRAQLSAGQAYGRASAAYIYSFPSPLRDEIIGVYSDSLKVVWIVAITIAAFSFFFVFIEKDIRLRTELETDFGIKIKTGIDKVGAEIGKSQEEKL